MPNATHSRSTAMLAAAGFAALAVGLSAIGQDGNPHTSSAVTETHTKASLAWRKAESCGLCHREVAPSDRERLPRLKEVGDFVLLTEYATWVEKDVHSKAFDRLATPRASEMSAKLGYDVRRDARCLSCHAPGWAAGADGELVAREGVTCVACHGAYADWVAKHGEDFERWVGLSRAQKWSDYGMRDLRAPAVRARTCVSCHVGSTADGRVITHDMFVAGHPPLSGWESSAWVRGMAPHWRSTKDVPYLQAAPPELRARYGFEEAEFEQTRHTLAGGVAVLAATLELLGAHATARSDAKVPEGPEFARFDCRACHHDLRREAGKPSWRQARGFAAAPGRPPLAEWTLALIPIAIEAAAEDAAEAEALTRRFRTDLKAVDTALGARPFGAADATAQSCGRLVAWLQQLSGRLDSAPLNRPKVVGLVQSLVKTASAETYDFDSARQVAWAIESLVRDLNADGMASPEAQAVFDAWKAELDTVLPAWHGPDLHDSLAAFLNQGADFDPIRFRQQLGTLANALPTR